MFQTMLNIEVEDEEERRGDRDEIERNTPIGDHRSGVSDDVEGELSDGLEHAKAVEEDME